MDNENSSLMSLGELRASHALRSSDTAAAGRQKSQASKSTVSRVYLRGDQRRNKNKASNACALNKKSRCSGGSSSSSSSSSSSKQ
jgi:hypothetical protein